MSRMLVQRRKFVLKKNTKVMDATGKFVAAAVLRSEDGLSVVKEDTGLSRKTCAVPQRTLFEQLQLNEAKKQSDWEDAHRYSITFFSLKNLLKTLPPLAAVKLDQDDTKFLLEVQREEELKIQMQKQQEKEDLKNFHTAVITSQQHTTTPVLLKIPKKTTQHKPQSVMIARPRARKRSMDRANSSTSKRGKCSETSLLQMYDSEDD